jgi:hypothetical protein
VNGGLRVDRPEHVERLWAEGEPLTAATLPSWLDLDDAPMYRRVAASVPVGEERSRLEVAGLVVDETGVYVKDPSDDGIEIFSIGIASGASPLELAVETRPVLTREDVSDLTALTVADPFMLRRGGLWHMFFEAWDWHVGKGAIALAVSADGLEWAYQQVVLEEEFHLSYPYVFEWDGDAYLVPESSRGGGVRLYRAASFPDRWECVAELVAEEELVDPSPFHADDRWWLLAGTTEHDALRLFAAPAVTGPWREHPGSPVVSNDPVRARPAGRVLVDDSRIVRFAQRCDTGYGLDVRAFEIVELTPEAYAERDRGVVLAAGRSAWNAGGMHHVDAHRLGAESWLACVDGWRAAGDPYSYT